MGNHVKLLKNRQILISDYHSVEVCCVVVDWQLQELNNRLLISNTELFLLCMTSWHALIQRIHSSLLIWELLWLQDSSHMSSHHLKSCNFMNNLKTILKIWSIINEFFGFKWNWWNCFKNDRNQKAYQLSIDIFAREVCPTLTCSNAIVQVVSELSRQWKSSRIRYTTEWEMILWMNAWWHTSDNTILRSKCKCYYVFEYIFVYIRFSPQLAKLLHPPPSGINIGI